jgi:hypothetical protein
MVLRIIHWRGSHRFDIVVSDENVAFPSVVARRSLRGLALGEKGDGYRQDGNSDDRPPGPGGGRT